MGLFLFLMNKELLVKELGFNGFQKKTQKTPESEIEKAVKLKNEYYASKP